jgi:hypothetical protein
MEANAYLVKKITYRDMPTATRPELMGALDQTATLSQSDVLAQLERLDARDREQRMLDLTTSVHDMTAEVRTWAKIAATAAIAALLVAAADVAAAIAQALV